MGITCKSLAIEEDLDRGIMVVAVTGKLDVEDYDVLGEEFDHMLERHGRVRLLIELKDFHGWTAGAAWEDARLGFRHYGDIEKMAIVGENKWQQGMTQFVRPFTRAEVRYFDAAANADASADASDWVHAPE